MRWISSRPIHATPERVFRTVADPEEFQRAIPGGSQVEYLTPSRTAWG
jgi:carbon monoxide dehydrogenase subunit G